MGNAVKVKDFRVMSGYQDLRVLVTPYVVFLFILDKTRRGISKPSPYLTVEGGFFFCF